MEKIYIILVEDQREVLQAVAKDMEYFEDAFMIEECESAAEALSLMENVDKKGNLVALVISDHVMPDKSGVDFLIEINNDLRFQHTRKILLTGLATHQDTIRAINHAAIDKYYEKPWKSEALIAGVKTLITGFILEKGVDYRPYLPYLDPVVLFDSLRKMT
ncbi:MAG: response regulator [Bacteroidia bacterium]|nr:response regulator [Bacteroidia bacterium]